MKKLTTLLVCLLLPGLMAQQPPEMEKPGEHHQHLKQWVGTWDVKSKMHMIPGQVIEGTYVEVARLQEGGFWLISDVRGKVLGMGSRRYLKLHNGIHIFGTFCCQ